MNKTGITDKSFTNDMAREIEKLKQQLADSEAIASENADTAFELTQANEKLEARVRELEVELADANEMNFKDIANKYGVTLIEIDHDGYGRNGGSSGGNEISIKPCDEEYMYELSFWHELGHILVSRSMIERTHVMSRLSHEGMAWELGLTEAARHGRLWDYGSEEMKWARKQMASYVNGEYDDLKEYYENKKDDV